jgi:hypothetical protein
VKRKTRRITVGSTDSLPGTVPQNFTPNGARGILDQRNIATPNQRQ